MGLLDDKVILVTGGTGSFSHQFVEVVLRNHRPKKLILYSRDELKQHEMSQQFPDERLRFFIGDVRDKERLSRAMTGVDFVIHAAALKQVPACEYNPFEAVKTNIIGAVNIIDTAIDRGVKRVVALSSDKAVGPISLYGATKLCAEKLFMQGNAYAGLEGARFCSVRYGNVVASRGSVIPLFREQRATGSITVTDRRMTRFWITLDQGVALVLRALETMHGGEIFVPKIPSMSIMDLVEAIAPGCAVAFTGIRPGEKLHEVLISTDEAHHTLEFDDMFVIQPPYPWWKMERWAGGKPLKDGFMYSSQNNAQQLTVERLREMVAHLDLRREPTMVSVGADGREERCDKV